MECIRGKTHYAVGRQSLLIRVAPYDEILIDIGTGDGRFALHAARTRPQSFTIGVDACRENLRSTSRTAPDNALFVVANALALPADLDGLATRVTINFPWGSLLEGLLAPESGLLSGLMRISRPSVHIECHVNAGALAEIDWTLEAGVDQIRRTLHRAGFDPGHVTFLDARFIRQVPTTWAKRLAFGLDPRACRIQCRAAFTQGVGWSRAGTRRWGDEARDLWSSVPSVLGPSHVWMNILHGHVLTSNRLILSANHAIVMSSGTHRSRPVMWSPRPRSGNGEPGPHIPGHDITYPQAGA